MAQFVSQFPFYLGGPIQTIDADGCWIGTPSDFEASLLLPFDTYALEQLRLRFLYTLTTTHNSVKGARVLLQMSFETEVGTILTKMIETPADLFSYKICERRRFIPVDQDMHLQRYLIGPGLRDVEQIPGMPASYMEFLTRYLVSDYPRYRMSAIATAICVARVLVS